ncbi:MAG: response regulator transcription factor [Bacteroidetes bacterium]|nr:response regulator transcription factor [Bacteroidota bacterium]
MKNILIIDDEAKTRQMLADIINLNCKDARVTGFAEDIKSGLIAIEKYKPDLILLDIKLPDGTGFDLLTKINYKIYNFRVIFITAFEEYAIKAFKFSAVDYILKPVDPDELLDAIEKCRIQTDNEYNQKFETYYYNSDKQSKNKKLFLKTLGTINVLEIKDIIRCESDGCYTTFYTNNNRKIIISKTIKEYEELLNDQGFFRVHQSHIINLNYIESFENKNGGFVIMKDKSKIPVSSRKKDMFLKILNSSS